MILTLVLLTRFFWPIDTLTYAQKGTVHTHIAVTGYVTYTALEDDGDLHIRLCDSPSVVGMDKTRCIIAECIPALPCTRPAKGNKIVVRGISRRDPEHGWNETHPVESWELAP